MLFCNESSHEKLFKNTRFKLSFARSHIKFGAIFQKLHKFQSFTKVRGSNLVIHFQNLPMN